MENSRTCFLLPLKDLVIYPKAITGILIGREKSINLVSKIDNREELIFITAQKNTNIDIISKDTLFEIGTLCRIIQQSKVQNGQKRIVIEGVKRAKMIDMFEDDKFYFSTIEEIEEHENTEKENEELEKYRKIVFSKIKEYFSLSGKFDNDLLLSLEVFKMIDELIFYSSAVISLPIKKRQSLLEENTDLQKIKKFIEIIEIEISLTKLDKSINNEVEKKLIKNQRRFYLNEKIKTIKKELGNEYNEENDVGEIAELKKKIKKIKLSKDAKDRCIEEVKKLEKMPNYVGEYHIIKNYIDYVLNLPWNITSRLDTNLLKAEKILNRDHFGLEKIKERILEFLAVYQKKNKLPGQIICLVGPPGVGKTSLAKSIAEALNRKYVKISLGGVRDEAEIRGHRKTYIGAMPGKIISSIKKIGTNNPLILLDEIDKIGSDFKGDPASALLEVLDPEQNKKFEDHYLDLEFDLSNIMFITTANDISGIPIPLRDRMEIIRLSGYTEEEKLNIAKNYLIPKELELHGLKSQEFSIDDSSIIEIVRKYTFEAGVRNLERELAKIIRKTVKKIIVDNKIKSIKINLKNLSEFLGVQKFDYNKVKKNDLVGVAVGLAYTDFGGDLLNIESLKFSGNGKLITTGKLGEVMKESAQAAFSYVRSVADNFDVKPKEFNKYDFHLHVPEGATPKDGPSAGVAIVASLLSSMTGMKINKDVAMTGEISLTGQVMPIGGLKEKLLAALRGNIKTVVIPKDNKKNLEDMPENVKENLKIIPVDNLNDALKIIVKGYKGDEV
jgi:ATP-dependent Lon protease